MKKRNFLKAALVSFAAIAVALTSINPVQAAQIDYNDPNNQQIHTPRFNAYKNVPAGIGDESDFVTLRKSNGDPTVPAAQSNFIDPVNAACTVGEKFDIRTYIHNVANDEFNNNGTGTAIAKNVNVAMQAPLGVTNNKFTFRGSISASNAASVTDTGVLNCENNVRLRLVPQTVKVYSKLTGWNGAPDSAVNGNLKIGSQTAGSGDVWGCWEHRVVVVYVVEVVKAPQPPKQEVRCDAILVEKIGERRYRYGVRYTATNGATLNSVKYNFGDGNSQTVTTPFTAEHQYASAGEFKVTTDLTFTVNDEEKVVTDAKCATTVKTSVEPCPTNPNLPKDSPDCQPCPYNPNLPKDSKDCVNVPPVIPSTGIGGILGGLMGSSATAYSAYALYQKRRALKSLR